MTVQTKRTSLLAAVGLAATLAGPPAQGQPIPGDPVTIDSGRVAGTLLPSGVRGYFGIPFAAPPVGPLRWRDPVPPRPWNGVYQAVRFAPECIQPLRAHNINHYFGEEATSEDCLYLNVWAPPEPPPANHPYPVVVWIYGGAFLVGSAAMPIYSGAPLAAKGVVYIGMNYRVGPFGFFAHPELTAESPHRASGNYGLLDQVEALRWVQKNAAAFGGDPGNVTVMGQSAGSFSVALLQVDPLAHGLFHRGMGMSGAPYGGLLGPVSLTQAEQQGLDLQTALKAGSLAAMRDMPADRIAQAAGPRPRNIAIDGYSLPADPTDVFAKHRQADVPLIVGFNADEGFRSLGPIADLQGYRDAVAKAFGAHADAVLGLYPATTDAAARRAAVEIGRDSTVAAQMNVWARNQAAFGKAPVYAYFYSRVHPYADGVTFADHDPHTVGAYHTGDTPYWLGTLDSLNIVRKTRDWTAGDRTMSDKMSDLIVAFARSGDLNTANLFDWPAYHPESERVAEFGPGGISVRPWPNAASLPLFETIFEKTAKIDPPARARD